MNGLQLVGFFVGLPLALVIVIAVLVFQGSWRGRGEDLEAGPLLVVSDAAVPDPAVLPREIASGLTTSYVGGGCSGRW